MESLEFSLALTLCQSLKMRVLSGMSLSQKCCQWLQSTIRVGSHYSMKISMARRCTQTRGSMMMTRRRSKWSKKLFSQEWDRSSKMTVATLLLLSSMRRLAKSTLNWKGRVQDAQAHRLRSRVELKTCSNITCQRWLKSYNMTRRRKKTMSEGWPF